MSGLRSPPVAAVKYCCRICRTPVWIAKSCIERYECDGQPLEYMQPVDGIPTRCSPCARIKQAIDVLSNVVVQKPYLVTEGMAAAPPKAAWEAEERNNLEADSEDGSRGDGMKKKGRQAFRDKIIKSFVDTAGQGLTEQEVYGDGTFKEAGAAHAGMQVDEDRRRRSGSNATHGNFHSPRGEERRKTSRGSQSTSTASCQV